MQGPNLEHAEFVEKKDVLAIVDRYASGELMLVDVLPDMCDAILALAYHGKSYEDYLAELDKCSCTLEEYFARKGIQYNDE
jgi:hypothetical protein